MWMLLKHLRILFIISPHSSTSGQRFEKTSDHRCEYLRVSLRENLNSLRKKERSASELDEFNEVRIKV